MDAAAFIACLPADMRETGTIGAVSAPCGMASVSAEVAASLYGTANRYKGSRWLDAARFGEPASQTRYTGSGTAMIIIGVKMYPGMLRRIDLGQDVV
jgi:hypothetical protein